MGRSVRRAAAVAGALLALFPAAPASAADDAIAISRICYVAHSDAAAVRVEDEQRITALAIVHGNYAVCTVPVAESPPGVTPDALAERFPHVGPLPELPVAVVQCSDRGATVAQQSQASLSPDPDVRAHAREGDLGAAIASCAGELGSSLTRTGRLPVEREPEQPGRWAPGDVAGCAEDGSVDPRLAAGGGKLNVVLLEEEIEILPRLVVEIDEEGIEIVDDGSSLTVELIEEEIEIVEPQPAGTSDVAPEAGEDVCGTFEQTLWECGETGWKRGDCMALDLFIRCGIEVTITNPGEEGFTCTTVEDAERTAAEVGEILRLTVCGGLIARPAPGEDPCGEGSAVFGAPVDNGPDGCDPLIASGEGGMGCPEATEPQPGAGGGPIGPLPELP